MFVAEDGAPPTYRDMALWPREKNVPHRAHDSNEHVDPMAYTLLFPDGRPGWHWHLQHEGPTASEKYTRVTPMQFYSANLTVRPGLGRLPHCGRYLPQQYIVDVYVRSEARRLHFLRESQKQLRAENYKGLTEYVKRLDDGDAPAGVGRPVILPATYDGSPRACQQYYLDAMSIVRKTGKPDYFITMTANPSWPEVLEALPPGQLPRDRPDIVARVFELKWKQLLREITEESVLGKAVAWIWSIEFQHGHFCVTVQGADKMKISAEIDARVCAEFPSAGSEIQSELHRVVEASMIHGPCGVRNPNAPCMLPDGTCEKHFPAPDFVPETRFREGPYPLYRRREMDET